MDLYSLFPFDYPSWLIEMVSNPILFTLSIIFVLFLYQRLKRRISNGEFHITDNQAKAIGVIGIVILIFIARW